MKIVIVCYYGLVDSIECAAKALTKLGHDVGFYPLFKYVHDIHDRRSDYLSHFVNEMKEVRPDVLLWWYVGIPASAIRTVKQETKAYNVLFNWDDPWTWYEKDMKIEEKSSCFDLVVTCCRDSVPLYLECGVKKAIYALPGYDPLINFPLNNKDYDCDVSFCCTNLYDETKFDHQYVKRKKLVDDLTKCTQIKFHLYGPQLFSHLYPQHYVGMVDYKNLNTVFNRSKINLCTHVVCDGDGYLNERTILVLGSGGVLLVDKVKGIEGILEKDSYILLEREGYIEQILSLLSDKKRLKCVRRHAVEASKLFTWDQWAAKVMSNIFFESPSPIVTVVHDDINHAFRLLEGNDEEMKAGLLILNNVDCDVNLQLEKYVKGRGYE